MILPISCCVCNGDSLFLVIMELLEIQGEILEAWSAFNFAK